MQWFRTAKCEKVYMYCVGFEYLLLFLDIEAQYMVILFMVFIVQFSVSSACLAINREQQVRWTSSFSPLKQLLVGKSILRNFNTQWHKNWQSFWINFVVWCLCVYACVLITGQLEQHCLIWGYLAIQIQRQNCFCSQCLLSLNSM